LKYNIRPSWAFCGLDFCNDGRGRKTSTYRTLSHDDFINNQGLFHMQINFDLKKPVSKINEYQKRFWVEWALDSNGSAYNISLVYKIQGNLDRIALKQACDFFIKKHPVVQTLFNQDGSQQLHDGLVAIVKLCS
jgi:hypothetical protein